MSSEVDSCPECGGSGTVECLECKDCSSYGSGVIPPDEAPHKQTSCPVCEGTGIFCATCGGSREV